MQYIFSTSSGKFLLRIFLLFPPTATIIFEYLRQSGLPIAPRYATGLFYAIRSETQNLGRDSTGPDMRAFGDLFPHVDNRIISRIEHAPVPRSYLALLHGAFQATRLYGTLSITLLERMPYPDVPAELADLLLRVDEVAWALVAGNHGGQVYLSLRTSEPGANAGKLLSEIVRPYGRAGGHASMAGGKIGRRDEITMRSTAVAYGVPLVTTLSAAEATVGAIDALRKKEFRVKSLQEYHAEVRR